MVVRFYVRRSARCDSGTRAASRVPARDLRVDHQFAVHQPQALPHADQPQSPLASNLGEIKAAAGVADFQAQRWTARRAASPWHSAAPLCLMTFRKASCAMR